MVEHSEHRIQYGKEKLKVGEDPHIKAARTQIIVNLVIIWVVDNRNSHKHKQADQERNNQSNILIKHKNINPSSPSSHNTQRRWSCFA